MKILLLSLLLTACAHVPEGTYTADDFMSDCICTYQFNCTCFNDLGEDDDGSN